MSVEFTVAQKQRLTELNAAEDVVSRQFEDVKEREKTFKILEKELNEANKDALFALRDGSRRPIQLEIESKLVKWLTEEKGFTQVVTPIMLSRDMLVKMGIGEDHP